MPHMICLIDFTFASMVFVSIRFLSLLFIVELAYTFSVVEVSWSVENDYNNL